MTEKLAKKTDRKLTPTGTMCGLFQGLKTGEILTSMAHPAEVRERKDKITYSQGRITN